MSWKSAFKNVDILGHWLFTYRAILCRNLHNLLRLKAEKCKLDLFYYQNFWTLSRKITCIQDIGWVENENSWKWSFKAVSKSWCTVPVFSNLGWPRSAGLLWEILVPETWHWNWFEMCSFYTIFQPKPKPKKGKKKVAAAPLVAKKVKPKKEENPLFERRPRSYGIGKL